MKLVYQYMAILFIFSPTLNHLHPLQVENCDSNSRLVVVNSGSKRLREWTILKIIFQMIYIVTKVVIPEKAVW